MIEVLQTDFPFSVTPWLGDLVGRLRKTRLKAFLNQISLKQLLQSDERGNDL